MSRVGGLGRGLDALIPTAAPGRSGLSAIPLDAIEPNPQQPRNAFDERSLSELAQSLQTVGLLQPIVVRDCGGERYQIIAGERRYRAAQLAGFTEISAVVRDTDDDQVLTEALVENIHRVDLNPLEEAGAYQQLLDDFGFTHEQLAARLGKSRSTITNALRLLTLRPTLQAWVAEGRLSAGHARALLAIEDPELRERAARQIVADGLSVRAAEELVRQTLASRREGNRVHATREHEPERGPYVGLERRLSEAFATRVKIAGTQSRGQLVIDYAGREDLQRLLALLEEGVGSGLQREHA